MAKMTRDEAIKNVTAYVYMECENMPKDVIRALDVLKDSALAWDKVKEEVADLCNQWEHRVEVRETDSCYNDETNNIIALSNQLEGMKRALNIVNKHLGELQQEER